MQFSDPQSGARIDDLSHSPLRDVPAVVMSASPTGHLPPGSVTNGLSIPTPPASSQDIGGNGAPSDFTQVPSPVFSVGNSPGVNMPMPPRVDSPNAQTTFLRPIMSPNGNGNGSNGTGFMPGTQNELRFTTRIENNKVMTRGKVEFDKISRLSAPIGGIVLDQRTEKYDAQGNVMRASNGEPIKVDLQRGVLLFTGQQIAHLDDRYPQAQYAVAKTKLAVAEKEAKQTIGIQYARAQYDTAYSDWKRSFEIAQRTSGAVTAAELELKAFKVKESELQMEKAQSDHDNQQESVRVQEQEVLVAQTQLDLRKVKTPFNGMVVNVISQVGNYLREGEPIAEVAQLDKLKISTQVDGNRITQEQVDKKRVTVTARNPNGQDDVFEGFVRYAAPTFDSNRQFPVEIEVDNRLVNGYWQLLEGDFVDVVIHL
jgi:biotin carboxyl carrier protein